MARQAGRPIFFRRENYRTRRWRDAARILPLAGSVLWLIPLMRPPGTTSNSAILIYVFAVWTGLILAARIIAPHTRADQTDDGDG